MVISATKFSWEHYNYFTETNQTVGIDVDLEDKGIEVIHPLPDDVKARSCKYVGNNVVWYGNPDEMIVIHKDNVNGMFGNVYDHDKMDFIVDLIQNQDGRDEARVELETSYAYGEVVSLGAIAEEQNAYLQDRFQTDYDGLESPRSTGDEELDRYLGVEYLDEFDELAQYIENSDLYKVKFRWFR